MRRDWFHAEEMLLLAAVAVLLLVSAVTLCERPDIFEETPISEPAVQADSVWVPPAAIARHCVAFDGENFDCTETR